MWKFLFNDFLNRNNLCSCSQKLQRVFFLAYLFRQEYVLTKIEEDFPGFRSYRRYLKGHEALGLIPTEEQISDPQILDQTLDSRQLVLDAWYQNLSDDEFCSLFQDRFLPDGTASRRKFEIDLLPYLLQWSNLQSPAIADIGCGGCHHLIFAKKMGLVKGRAFGYDASFSSLEFAQMIASQEGAAMTFTKGNCLKLPFADNSLGQIWMISVLPWVVKWRQALDEAARVLTSSGRIILVINDNEERCIVDTGNAVAHLKQLGFHVDDVTHYSNNSDYIAAGKR